jgi:hypothetical protein
VLWVATAAACALLARRVGGEAAGAAAAFALTMLALKVAANEPGHPQGLCGLLTILAVLAMTFVARRPRAAALVLGTLVAAMAMTKLNLGVFVATAMLLALLGGERENRLVRAAAYLTAAGALALPLVLMRDNLATWSFASCMIIEAAMLPTIVLALAGPVGYQPAAGMVPWFLGSLAASAAVIAAVTLGMGTTPKGLWHGLVVQHIHWAQVFSVPPYGLTKRPMALAVLGMLVGLAHASGVFRSPALIRALKVVYVGGVLRAWLLYGLEYRFSWDMQQLLQLWLFYGLPWSWLVLAVEPSANCEGVSATMPLSRVALGLATPLVALMVYPVAGSQVFYASLPFLVGASVCGADILRWLNRQSWPRRLVAAGLWALALTFLSIVAYGSVKTYRANEPLGLPGASRIRLPANDAATYRWLAERLHADCDTFVGLPGINSLYFWAEKAPPTTRSPGDWLNLLTEAQQAEVVAALDSRARVMAVRNRKALKVWLRDGSTASGPLARYIESMEIVGRRGDFELLMRPSSAADAVTRTPDREGGR